VTAAESAATGVPPATTAVAATTAAMSTTTTTTTASAAACQRDIRHTHHDGSDQRHTDQKKSLTHDPSPLCELSFARYLIKFYGRSLNHGDPVDNVTCDRARKSNSSRVEHFLPFPPRTGHCTKPGRGRDDLQK
jgi:hypothetical protein